MSNPIWQKLEWMAKRCDGQCEWLIENHPEVFGEQKHCNPGTVERAYWHSGYSVALMDVLNLLGIPRPLSKEATLDE